MDDGQYYPLLNLPVYVSGPPEDTYGFSWWLGRAGCWEVSKPESADLVIFTGGYDVNPKLYGEEPLEGTFYDDARDKEDLALYDICKDQGIPMLGICRGSQFLWTRLGGRLYQDVNNHNSGQHDMIFAPTGEKYRISSVHHQAIVPRSFAGLSLLGKSHETTVRKTDRYVSNGFETEYEIWAVENKGILGIQGHPEYKGFPNYSRLCAEVLERYIVDSDSTERRDCRLRIKEIN